MFELRKHQTEIIGSLREAIAGGSRRPLVFAPCSFGKTIVSAEIARLTVEKGGKVLFLVHRRLLAIQTAEKFRGYGLSCSILMAGEDADMSCDIIITTVQTYSRRLRLDDYKFNRFFHDASIAFVDEAHLGISEMFTDIYRYYEDKIIIGLTGSPARGDQRGLGEVFDKIVQSIGIKELTEQGYLAPVRYFAADAPDLSGVGMVAGDYNKGQLQEKMNNVELVGDVVGNWLKLANGRSTIVFSTGVKHSISLADEFNSIGVPAAHLDSKSSHEDRMDVLDKFRSGELTVVTNCQLFTEGYDADFVSCVAIARPTKSLPLWIQMAGRGQRISDGKHDCLLLDYGGNIERHGFLTDDVEWTLDGKEKAWTKSEKVTKEKKPMRCTACNLVFEGGDKCPDCASPVKTFGRKVDTVDADLQELLAKKQPTMAEKRVWYGMALHYVKEKGWKEGAAAQKYKQKFGVWPNKLKDTAPIEPDSGFLAYQKYLQIKWAKRRK